MNRTWVLEWSRDGGQTWEELSRGYGMVFFRHGRLWQETNANIWSRIRPLLTMAEQQEVERQEMADRQTTAKRDGNEMGRALRAMLGNPSVADTGAVFAVGRRFATMAGYADAEGAFAYIEGFVAGFAGKAPYAPPQVTDGGSDGEE